MDWIKLISSLRQLRQIRNQSQRNAVMAIATGAGAVCSLIVGGIVDFLITKPEQQPNLVYSVTILASFILMPLSYFIGIKIFDFLRAGWSESEDELLQLKFHEDELRKEINLLSDLKLPNELEERKKQELLAEYYKEREILLEKRFLRKRGLENTKRIEP